MSTHKCNKETEIELIKQGSSYTNKKLDEIYKLLVGNGRKGLCDEIREAKGAVRATQFVFGVVISVVTILIMVFK